jgi:hypothetical protein
MKITKHARFGSVPRTYESLEDYADSALDGADYDQGALEDLVGTANNVKRAVGRLLDVLAENGLLTAPEVEKVLRGWVDSDEDTYFGEPTPVDEDLGL